MKWVLSIFASLVLALCIPGFAQNTAAGSNGSPSPQNNGNSSSQSSGTTYGGDQTGMNSMHSPNANASQDNANGQNQGKQKSLEGCVVREDTYYYLQPKHGQRVRLSPSSDVSQNEGHHVRLHGSQSNSNATNNGSNQTANSGASESQSQDANSAGGMNSSNGQEFLVSRVDLISSTCPAEYKGNSGSSSSPNSQQQ
jgi:hypothetical protein